MMNNNKILTVSYGTFSCTLEGFDDSFGTMKAIAEYFRDLAADDRYFGAEPPQPDADMLARIAQKEVSRRVQAREQDGKIVLSAIEDQATAAPLAAAAITSEPSNAPAEVEPVAATPAKTPAVEVSTAASDVVMPEPEAPQAVTVEEPAPLAPTTVAETLAAPDDTSEADADAPQAEEDKVAVVAEASAAAEPEFIEDENDIVPGQPDSEVEAFFAESSKAAHLQMEEDEIEADNAPAAPQITAVEAEDVAPAKAPAPDSIAAKLQRIRAVVAQHEEDDEEDDYLEDEHAEAEPANGPSADDVIADARAEIEEALDADDATIAEAETATAEDASEEDDVSAILSRLKNTAGVKAADVTAKVSEPLEDLSLADVEDTSEEASVEDTVSNLFDSEAGLSAETPATAAPAEGSEPQANPATAADENETGEAAEAVKPAPRARVIKVKRADLEAAIDKGDLEEYGDDAEETSTEEAKAPAAPKLDDLAPSRGKKESTLSEEDAAELARELAELEQENNVSDQEDTPAEAPQRRSEAARHSLPAIDETTETDVNRLLAETDHQMDEPGSATRRDAFAHLRAAVAAKKADVAMGGKGQDAEGDGAYREDLAEVVRPRRPTSTTARTERPGESRPAPLKLVAEQRIDVQKPAANAGPVRPRRIAAAAEEVLPAADGESFTDFAAEMGASTLPQLLEAAAAYMSFVEGRDQFSRPQLMTKVRQAGVPEGFSREEGLRSFGQLLRAGKIEKIKGGRFTVSDDIGYRPDERAAG